MPRNGLGVMSWPPNTNGVPNTTVSSTRYNAFLADLLADLNAVRPITSGGTGGTSAVSGNDGLNTSGADMASAATLNLANATGVVITVTGTTGITALGTVSSGAMRTLIFAGALTLTHNATSLILPGAANITTAAGDVAEFRSKGAGNWVCVGYLKASGVAIVSPPDATTTAKGLIEIASAAEVKSSSDSTLAVTPGTVKDAMAWFLITYAASIPVDHNNGVNQSVILTGNGAFAAPTNLKPGYPLNIYVAQDATGGRVPTWNAAYDFGDFGVPVGSTGANQADMYTFLVLTTGRLIFMGIRRRAD